MKPVRFYPRGRKRLSPCERSRRTLENQRWPFSDHRPRSARRCMDPPSTTVRAPEVHVRNREFNGRILLGSRGPAGKLTSGIAPESTGRRFSPLFEVTPVDSTPLLNGWFTRQVQGDVLRIDPGSSLRRKSPLRGLLIWREDSGAGPLRDFSMRPAGTCVGANASSPRSPGRRVAYGRPLFHDPSDDGMIILRSARRCRTDELRRRRHDPRATRLGI